MMWYYLILLALSSVGKNKQMVLRVLHMVHQTRLTGLDEGGT